MNKIKKVIVNKEPYLSQASNYDASIKQLYLVGRLPKEKTLTVLIVGSRKLSYYGKEVARRLAYGLAKRGAVIVSGLALGIDGEVHRAALEAGGTTIAVLANGLDQIAPSSHTNLARQIVLSGGAILSEYEPGTPPMKHQFIARNRIESAISDVVIIIEAAAKSGTLITAGFAIEHGKPVYAVPGNITSPLSRGCNQLIAQGAIPIVDIDETIEAIAPLPKAKKGLAPRGDTEAEQILLDLVFGGIREGDELHQASKLDASLYQQTLTLLEIKGMLKSLGANRWGI